MANWPNITYQNDNDITDEIVIRHQGINYLQKRDILSASISNARWSSDANYEIGSEVKGSDNKWYIAVVNNGSGTGNSTDPVTRLDDSVWKESLIKPEVSPRNKQWNGYLDPEHQSSLPAPNGYPATSGGGGTSYTSDQEISQGIFAGASGATVSSDSDGWIVSAGSIYRLYTYTIEQLADININTAPVFIKDESGNNYYINNSTTGVTVSKPDTTTLRVEIDSGIFAELGITKLWRWFDTEKIGCVIELSPDESIKRIGSPVVLADNPAGWANGSVIALPDISKYTKLYFFCGNEERYSNLHYVEDLLDNIGVTFNIGTYSGGSGEVGSNRITVQSTTQITVTSIGVNGAGTPLLFKVAGEY